MKLESLFAFLFSFIVLLLSYLAGFTVGKGNDKFIGYELGFGAFIICLLIPLVVREQVEKGNGPKS